MDWDAWHRHYDSLPSLQERLRIVRAQIIASLDECPPGPIRIVSACAGDGRDLIGALSQHPRRENVQALLLDNHEESIERGRVAAEASGLARQFRFVRADAGLACHYAEGVPAHLVLLSGFLGHLRNEEVPHLIKHLSMFCQREGSVIWNRHLVLNKGRDQVAEIRELFREHDFEEVDYQITDPEGFAAGRVRFTGSVRPLNPQLRLFEFIGLDQLLSVNLPSPQGTDPETAFPQSGAELPTADECLIADLHPVERTLPERFEDIVRRHGARQALGSGEWRPTYAELDGVANRWACQLMAKGGAVGERVGILMRHDNPLIAAVLAILKAGRVVVVLNGTDPPARLREIIDDAQASVLITDSVNRPLAEKVVSHVDAILDFEVSSQGPIHSPQVEASPGALAFLVYTSGSTGRPKGVMQTHRNILHNVRRHSQGMALRAEDRILLLASLSGGQGLGTTWCALMNGSALCLFPAAERGVVGLADWLEAHAISVYVSSASVFRHFVKAMEKDRVFPRIRLVRLASEPASTTDFAAFQKHFPKESILLSTYSSSESGSITHQAYARQDRPALGRLAVGKSKAGVEFLLWDETGHAVGHGETGEIIVRSRFLSPGYWRNDALTAERFFQDERMREVRLFRSGDLGRLLADGSLMFMGRRDHQVKLHGYRVELSEIEDALAAQPEVQSAVVIPYTSTRNETQLCAYVVGPGGKTGHADVLRRKLRESLPGYMVPSQFVFLDHLPLTPHGKWDRQALPSPQETPQSMRPVLKPRDIVERNLVKIFESVLGISPVGRNDDFFDLGGTSLQSVEVMASIEEVFDVALPPSALVEHSTVEGLAPLLSSSAVIPSARQLVVLRESNRGRPLFLVHSGQGDVVTYGLLVRKLRDRPVYGLQAVGVQGESWPLMSIPAMVDRYLPEIIAKDPSGPYFLAGTCMGGMVAFELARRLTQMGGAVGLLALIDSPTSPYSGRRSWWHEAMLDPLRDALRVLRWTPARILGLRLKVNQLPAYRRFVANMTGLANRRYRPGHFPGLVTLILTEDTPFPFGDRRSVITRHAVGADTITLPGVRSDLFLRPAVDELAERFQACLDQAEAQCREANFRETARKEPSKT